jgi:DNA-binding transcriptional ArsR family regulator
MPAELTLDLPWVEAPMAQLEGLVVRRGRADTLAYEDGIVLDVHVIDPRVFESSAALVDAARSSTAPGRVVLVAGVVPLDWRADLRNADVSFVDVSGVAEINWPRVHVSEKRFGKPVKRRRGALAFQKGHALVVQELLVLTMDGSRPTVGGLAEGAGVSIPTASKAVTQLAEHGLVVKRREGTWVSVEVVDRVTIATRLAERTSWPGEEMLTAFLWGRTIFDVAASISDAAVRADLELAVTGRVGAAYHGVLGTSSPKEVRCWVDPRRGSLADVAEELELEPSSEESANVLLSADRWRVGVHRRAEAQFDDFTASVAHPLRVWCDLHDEQRGSEYAAQMWGAVVDGR